MLESILVMVGVFLIAFMFAPVGMGGGMLFVPLLHYVADWPIDGTLLAVSLTLTWTVSIGSGLRHRRGLPARGQKTQSNARTRKGPRKTVAGKKSVKGIR